MNTFLPKSGAKIMLIFKYAMRMPKKRDSTKNIFALPSKIAHSVRREIYAG
jgi:hypothetical protein